MGPGDALFFYANTLHCSAANLSERSRNLLICCYNKATNDPYKPHHHPGYTPLLRVPDEAVLAAGARLADAGARWFLEEGKDETTEARRAG
jgi:ectoine hydroxylase-related dioxygenase (phytanoyl-CoA dioxygenase family)